MKALFGVLAVAAVGAVVYFIAKGKRKGNAPAPKKAPTDLKSLAISAAPNVLTSQNIAALGGLFGSGGTGSGAAQPAQGQILTQASIEPQTTPTPDTTDQYVTNLD